MVLATALTLASVGSSLLGSGMSFTNAMKQNKIKDQAEKDADAAMKAARKSLEKNYMDSLAIQKEPYELEREAMLSAGAQATEVARESERGAGRVGAIYAQQQQGQRQIASAMGQEMFNLDYLSTQEDTRLRDLNTQLDLGEVEGAQLQAANAEERRQQQLMAGAQGIGNAAATGLDALALYPNMGKRKQTAPASRSVLEGFSGRRSDLGVVTPSTANYNTSFLPPAESLGQGQEIQNLGLNLNPYSDFLPVKTFDATQQLNKSIYSKALEDQYYRGMDYTKSFYSPF
jgi:hypothetical protein